MTRKNEEGAVPRRGRRVALILGAVLCAGGCVTTQERPTPSPIEGAKHTFTISYNADGCPASAVVAPKTDLTQVAEKCAAGR
jgi:hypothetical protein